MKTHRTRTIRYCISTPMLVLALSACGSGTDTADDVDAAAQGNSSDTGDIANALSSGSVSTSDLSEATFVSSSLPAVVPASASNNNNVLAVASALPNAALVPEGEPVATQSELTDTGAPTALEIPALNPFAAIDAGSPSDGANQEMDNTDGSDQSNSLENTSGAGSNGESGDESNSPLAGSNAETQAQAEADARVSEQAQAEADAQAAAQAQAEADAQAAAQAQAEADAQAAAQAQAEADAQAAAQAQAEADAQVAAQAQAEADAQVAAQAQAEADAQAAAENSQSAVYAGQLDAGESLGPVQCAVINDTNQGFGDVTDSDWREWFDNYTYSQNEQYLSTGQDGNRAYLRQMLVPASNGSARVQAGRNLDSARTYRLTQSLYFEPGFDWGGTNEGGKVGFGFGGGTTPSGGSLQTDGFTLRLMWRGNRDGTAKMVAYSYAADRSQSLPWGDNYTLEGFEIPIGEWFDITLEVETNRTTGSSDGSLRAWINDNLVLQRDNVGWQTSGDRPAVQKLVFTTFYGGNDPSWSPSTTTYIRYADACWAPVRNPSGDLLDDPLSAADAQTPTVLLDDAVMTVRGQVIDSLSNIEILLPTEFMMVNAEIYSALDDINAALAGTRWPDNHSVPLGATAIEELTRAAETLSMVANSADAVPYIQEQTESNSQALITAARTLTNTARLQVRDALITNGCYSTADSAACSTANYQLAQAEHMLEQSNQPGLAVNEQRRLISMAWEEVNAAAALR